MTNEEKQVLRGILTSHKRDVLRSLRDLSGLAIERVPDPIENTRNKESREEEAQRIDSLSDQLGEIEVALEKLAEGDFGICEVCDEEIPMGRMVVNPTARLCVRDQERKERNNR